MRTTFEHDFVVLSQRFIDYRRHIILGTEGWQRPYLTVGTSMRHLHFGCQFHSLDSESFARFVEIDVVACGKHDDNVLCDFTNAKQNGFGDLVAGHMPKGVISSVSRLRIVRQGMRSLAPYPLGLTAIAPEDGLISELRWLPKEPG